MDKYQKRKTTPEAKESRRRYKYTKINNNSGAANRAYSRHDDGILPEDLTDDVSTKKLVLFKICFFQKKMVFTKTAAR